MKKIIRIIIGILLVCFSFYYTEQAIIFIREIDPIMKTINNNKSSYEKSSINAKIEDDFIIPGVNGITINKSESFNKMKSYGIYNEALTVFEEVKPTISVDDYYDKYISSGNGIYQDVGLVTKLSNNSDAKEIIEVLKNKNVPVTIFVDGLYLENNIDYINSIKNNNELEILSYDNNYKELYFSSSKTLLKSITNVEPKYCYAEYDNKEVLNLCSKLNLHTIIPTIRTGNYPYREIKEKVSNGSIIMLTANSSTKIELSTIVDYLRQKGYSFKTLDTLLSEAINEK